MDVTMGWFMVSNVHSPKEKQKKIYEWNDMLATVINQASNLRSVNIVEISKGNFDV